MYNLKSSFCVGGQGTKHFWPGFSSESMSGPLQLPSIVDVRTKIGAKIKESVKICSATMSASPRGSTAVGLVNRLLFISEDSLDQLRVG